MAVVGVHEGATAQMQHDETAAAQTRRDETAGGGEKTCGLAEDAKAVATVREGRVAGGRRPPAPPPTPSIDD